MSDTRNLVPQTLAPNALILGELKPTVFVRWIILAMDLGPLDYKEYEWPELEALLKLTRKPAQRLVKGLEEAGWLHQEKTRDGVRIYLFPTSDAAESHLERIKEQTKNSWKMNAGRSWKMPENKQPYRVKYVVENGNFTMVPETILKDGRFSHNELATYVVIRCTTNTGSFWGTRALAKAAGVSHSTFTLGLDEVTKAGYISYESRPRVSNRYSFNDAPEPASVQMEPVSVQQEFLSVQEEPVSVPINTEYNTKENTDSNNEPSSEAASYQDQEIPRETEGCPSGPERSDGITPSSFSDSSAISAVMHSIPAQRGTRTFDLDALSDEEVLALSPDFIRTLRGNTMYATGQRKARIQNRMKQGKQLAAMADNKAFLAEQEESSNG
ncbi:hypothetical protein GCM10015535_36050 [Streptomyces gelaticus]|uniref:MarR family transcriptional regulator n=1 Tax=Streptomyces gelaticus TaxID=285446 RepID=A0ABQ2W092_9ACTN|nr:hypothetical protein [Streptomyces gelaticus]GGV87060.1 hypothetical protein GCM10015535_36050 [Streptomyces gelaticus]